jgi:hypothetical protein
VQRHGQSHALALCVEVVDVAAPGEGGQRIRIRKVKGRKEGGRMVDGGWWMVDGGWWMVDGRGMR